MHLSSAFGLTVREIEDDGVSDRRACRDHGRRRPVDLGRAFSEAIAGFTETLDALRPDVLLVLGDRHEMLERSARRDRARDPDRAPARRRAERGLAGRRDAPLHDQARAPALRRDQGVRRAGRASSASSRSASTSSARRRSRRSGLCRCSTRRAGRRTRRNRSRASARRAHACTPRRSHPDAARRARRPRSFEASIDVIDRDGTVVVTLPNDDLGNVQTRQVLLDYAEGRRTSTPSARSASSAT